MIPTGDKGGERPAGRRALRSDARDNRARVLAAAGDLFDEAGLDTTVAHIAARAGVGKGTVYRGFPTKDALIAAVAQDWTEGLVERAARDLDEDTPLAGLHRAVRTALTPSGPQRAAFHLLRENRLPVAAAMEAIGALLRAAQAHGTARADLTVDDLRVLVSGIGMQLAADGVRDPVHWSRYADLVMELLRPQ